MDLIKRSAFEHIMERYPRPSALPGIVARSFYPTNPNPVHQAFARLIEAGVLEHIITPNYDVGLEQACSTICSATRMPQIIVSEDDARRASLSQPMIFKIHGCACPGREKSMVMALREEGTMPDWKRRLLELLIKGKPLLVCGYSGLDFEICPELIHLNPYSVTWNSYQDPRADENALTPNAKRVLSAKNGIALIGDMKRMLEVLSGSPCRAGFSKLNPSFVNDLVSRLDEWEIDKWRVWVFNGLSCALDGVEVAKRLYATSGTSIERKVDSLLALAEPLFHSGLYFQAGQAYREASLLAKSFVPTLSVMLKDLTDAESRIPKDEQIIADLLKRISDYLERILKSEIGIVESDRVAGRWLRARRKVQEVYYWLPALAPSQEREKIESEITLKRVLLRRYPYYLAKKVRLKPVSRRIQAKVISELSLAATYFSRKGSWFNLQHCEMLAGRFDIKFSDIYTGTMVPLASYEGYKHLGYILAEMMAYRGILADQSVSDPPMIYAYLIIAGEIGINPEVWKLARAMKKRFGRKILTPSTQEQAKRAWKTCEYTLPMRGLLLLRGSDP
ncbi:MAG TPA: SIR2 family protein [Blastocatellia bacterium]|nr:SIR2 family protein [Blastocatellia bacterium]